MRALREKENGGEGERARARAFYAFLDGGHKAGGSTAGVGLPACAALMRYHCARGRGGARERGGGGGGGGGAAALPRRRR